MQRRIDLLDEHYNVTVTGGPEELRMRVGTGKAMSVSLTSINNEESIIQLGEQKTRLRMATKGEKAYIKAFDRTFALSVMDPVEQAADESGTPSNTVRAPMPGMVVKIDIAAGDRVTKGQSLMTIESMKILMVITAVRDGEVAQVHFEPEETFDKNEVLITLSKMEIE